MPKEIYEIPASSPSYNVTYVTVVEDDSDDDVGDVRGGAGYTGMMVAWGCAVWGIGWYYPPVLRDTAAIYPVYYPSLSDLRIRRVVQPVDRRVRPRRGRVRTLRRSRRRRALQPAHRHLLARRRGLGTVRRARRTPGVQPADRHLRRRRVRVRTCTAAGAAPSVQRGDDWARTARVTNNRTGNTTRVTQGSGGGEAVTRSGPEGPGGVARTGSGDVYAGRDGNVYRNQGGGWQKYEQRRLEQRRYAGAPAAERLGKSRGRPRGHRVDQASR